MLAHVEAVEAQTVVELRKRKPLFVLFGERKAGAVVLGISRDTPKAQRKFKEKYDLPYPLLADVDEKACKQFDVLKEKNMYGKKVMGIERTTFLIGPDQKLLKVFPKVRPEGHAEEVLAELKSQG